MKLIDNKKDLSLQRFVFCKAYIHQLMQSKTRILIALLLAAGICQAQEELPVLSADRPGYTWGAEVLPLHKVSWENGFGFESSTEGTHILTANSTIVRYGIFKNTELRVGTDILLFNDGQSEKPAWGMAPLTIGTKLKVYESSNWLPSIGLLAEFKTRHVGSKELLPSHIAPSMYVLFQHEINDWFWLCYNAGLEWDGETATPQTSLSLVLGFNITDDIGTYVDCCNYLHPIDGNQYMAEFGVTWMVSRRLQFDVECDFDFQNIGQYFGFSGGVAWMIN